MLASRFIFGIFAVQADRKKVAVFPAKTATFIDASEQMGRRERRGSHGDKTE